MKLQPLDLAATRLCTDALARCTYPFDTQGVGVIVPVEVADLSRYARGNVAYIRDARGPITERSHAGEDPEELPGFGHIDVHFEDGEHGHGIIVRQQVLGLYFLPTPKYPGGRISVEVSVAAALQQEVLICELAHAIDYTAMTDAQRDAILVAYHGGRRPEEVGHVSDWFEESGELDYRDWVGESLMFGIVLAYTDMVPSFDFFTHKSTPDVVATIRQVLTPPPPAPTLYGFPGRKVFHKATCWTLKIRASKAVPLTREQASARRPCKICRPGPVL